jgi:26S proteasome regulatory subunit N7
MEIQYDIDEEIKKLDEKIKDAEENLGDVEVRDAILEKAEFYQKSNLRDKAIETFELALTKTTGIGKKMDVVFSMLRIVLNEKNLDQIKKYIDRCKKFLEEGGDWERKNRLKVVSAGQYMKELSFLKKIIKIHISR